MLPAVASSLLLLAGANLAAILLLRGARQRLEQRIVEVDAKLAALESLTSRARQEVERLEATLQRATRLAGQERRDTLTAIESLADPSKLGDARRLAEVADELPPLPSGLSGELFDDNRRTVSIAQLAAQGLTSAEIARRLNLPVGDVEFWLNLRSA